MKRLPLFIAIILTLFFSGLMYVTFLPIMWALGADKPYKKWFKFTEEITFNNQSTTIPRLHFWIRHD